MSDVNDIVALMEKAACVLAAKGADLLADKLQAAAASLSTIEANANEVVTALQSDIDAFGKADIRQAELDAITNWNHRHSGGDGEAWLPIESAPRDGTTVIVWFKQHGALSCRWTDRDDDPSSEWAHWHVDDFKHGPFPVRGYNDGDATHWRPLPAPPTDDADRAGERGVDG